MSGIPTTLSGIIGFVIVTAFLFSLFPNSPNNHDVEHRINDISRATAFINQSASVNESETVLGSHALGSAAGFVKTVFGFVYFAITDIFLVFSVLASWVTMVVSINPILSFVGAVITVLLVLEVAKRLTWGNH